MSKKTVRATVAVLAFAVISLSLLTLADLRAGRSPAYAFGRSVGAASPAPVPSQNRLPAAAAGESGIVGLAESLLAAHPAAPRNGSSRVVRK